MGLLGGQDESIKEMAELLIKGAVCPCSSRARSMEVQFACGQTPVPHLPVGEEGGQNEGNAEGDVFALHTLQGIQFIRNRNHF